MFICLWNSTNSKTNAKRQHFSDIKTFDDQNNWNGLLHRNGKGRELDRKSASNRRPMVFKYDFTIFRCKNEANIDP